MIKYKKLPRVFPILVLAVLMVTGLSSCGTAAVTSAPLATPSPSAITTDTPEQPTETPEPTSDEAIESLSLIHI